MLTKRQAETYRVVIQFIKENGRGPKLTEVQAALNLQHASGAQRLVQILIRKGVLRRDSGYQLCDAVWPLLPKRAFKAVYRTPDWTELVPLEVAHAPGS